MPSSDQGVTHDRYMLIPRTLIFLTRGEQVLLLKGTPHKRLWANRYNGVGGHVERGEDILSAARRELYEETGLTPIDLWLCGMIIVDSGGNPGIGIYILRGECPTGDPRPSPEGTLEWIAVNEIRNHPLVEDLFTLLPKVMTMRKGDPPFAAHYHYDDSNRLVIRFG